MVHIQYKTGEFMFNSTRKEERRKAYEKEIYQNWHNQRVKGKKSFVWRYGVLNWAGTTFALYWIIVMIIGWISKNPQPFVWAQFIVTFLMFLGFGIGYGHILWNRNEKIYLKRYPTKK